jgi:hypothetical protein
MSAWLRPRRASNGFIMGTCLPESSNLPRVLMANRFLRTETNVQPEKPNKRTRLSSFLCTYVKKSEANATASAQASGNTI